MKQKLKQLYREEAITLLGDVNIVGILHQLVAGDRRFSEFEGFGSKTLSSKLKKLEEHDLISRTLYAEVPPRAVYTMTQKGVEFCSIIDSIRSWEASWE